MSLCRWWWDYGPKDCDVYVYGSVGDVWVIETWNRKSDDSPLPPEFDMKTFHCETTDEAITQLQKMIAAGLGVPDDVIPELRKWEKDD